VQLDIAQEVVTLLAELIADEAWAAVMMVRACVSAVALSIRL
jgi:hypothetical protein